MTEKFVPGDKFRRCQILGSTILAEIKFQFILPLFATAFASCFFFPPEPIPSSNSLRPHRPLLFFKPIPINSHSITCKHLLPTCKIAQSEGNSLQFHQYWYLFVLIIFFFRFCGNPFNLPINDNFLWNSLDDLNSWVFGESY